MPLPESSSLDDVSEGEGAPEYEAVEGRKVMLVMLPPSSVLLFNIFLDADEWDVPVGDPCEEISVLWTFAKPIEGIFASVLIYANNVDAILIHYYDHSRLWK